ncbi:LysR substrate-binding domain-containing protein [Yersinia bercovieri]|uniref:LysR substrate-binding domain-containing protein n=1 Tax=Yersinia bercovieri TaxID=634 RepID=UPI0011A0808E
MINAIYSYSEFKNNNLDIYWRQTLLINSRSLRDLQAAKWYIPTASAGYFSNMETVIFPYGRKPTCSVLFGDLTTIAEQLVLNEDYLFVGPKAMLAIPYLQNIVTSIPIKEKLPDGKYSLIYRQQQVLPPLAKHLIDEIRFAYWELMSRQIT